MRRRIVCNFDVCIGCRLCEVYCITSHSRFPHDVLKAFKLDGQRPVPRVTVEEEGVLSFSVSCRHCQEPECTKSCLTGALQLDAELGIIKVDEERCIGCWTCVVACPYGAIRPSSGERKVAVKCDLCGGTGEVPACVANCPNEALRMEVWVEEG